MTKTHQPLHAPRTGFIALDVSFVLLDEVGQLLATVGRRDANLKDQLKRATQSVVLNLAESRGSRAGNRKLRFETALGSNYEVVAALRIAIAWKFLKAEEAERALQAADRVGALTHRLLHGRK